MPNPPWNVLSSGIPISRANITWGQPFEHFAGISGPRVSIPINANVQITSGGGVNRAGNYSGGVGATIKF